MTRHPRPRRTGRGDPLGSSIQHGAGCVVILAGVLALPAAILTYLLT